MPRATYFEISSIIVAKNEGLPKKDKFIVCPPSEPDEALTVYPPTSFYDNHGVDVFLSGNTAEFWIDGYKSRTLNSIQDADAIVKAIIAELEAIQKERAREFED